MGESHSGCPRGQTVLGHAKRLAYIWIYEVSLMREGWSHPPLVLDFATTAKVGFDS